eukprot:365735-Chlamydomonas_euryale.AAC.1
MTRSAARAYAVGSGLASAALPPRAGLPSDTTTERIARGGRPDTGNPARSSASASRAASSSIAPAPAAARAAAAGVAGTAWPAFISACAAPAACASTACAAATVCAAAAPCAAPSVGPPGTTSPMLGGALKSTASSAASASASASAPPAAIAVAADGVSAQLWRANMSASTPARLPPSPAPVSTTRSPFSSASCSSGVSCMNRWRASICTTGLMSARGEPSNGTSCCVRRSAARTSAPAVMTTMRDDCESSAVQDDCSGPGLDTAAAAAAA